MSERLQKILQKNAKFEKESPYNFCDRWCERCVQVAAGILMMEESV